MQQTNHYQLNQWDLEDRVLMADFNNDNTKIETALHGLAEETAGKADSGTVNTLSAAVSQKAEQSALAAEQTARQNADSVEQAARIAADSAEKAAREAADAALQGGITALTPRAGAQLLKTFELTETCSEFTVPLQDIAWDQWKAVHILVDITSQAGAQARIYLNNNLVFYVSGNTQADRSTHKNIGHLILYPMFDDRLRVGGLSLHESKFFSTNSDQYRNLQVLHVNFSINETVLPGTEVTVWGEK